MRIDDMDRWVALYYENDEVGKSFRENRQGQGRNPSASGASSMKPYTISVVVHILYHLEYRENPGTMTCVRSWCPILGW